MDHSNYHGYKIQDLEYAYEHLKDKNIIYLCGDSSFDNKFWVERTKPSSNYDFLDTYPNDVCHNINQNIPSDYACINCAVEETCLKDRDDNLLPQELFMVSKLKERDIILISLGGNDIALKPSVDIMFSLGTYLLFENSISYNYLYLYFETRFKKYLERINHKNVYLCGLYFPCVKGNGWCDTTLNLIGYNSNPLKIQKLIKKLYTDLSIKLNMKYIPLYECLDCNNELEYVQRVEPSSVGSEKIAKFITLKHFHMN